MNSLKHIFSSCPWTWTDGIFLSFLFPSSVWVQLIRGWPMWPPPLGTWPCGCGGTSSPCTWPWGRLWTWRPCSSRWRSWGTSWRWRTSGPSSLLRPSSWPRRSPCPCLEEKRDWSLVVRGRLEWVFKVNGLINGLNCSYCVSEIVIRHFRPMSEVTVVQSLSLEKDKWVSEGRNKVGLYCTSTMSPRSSSIGVSAAIVPTFLSSLTLRVLFSTI